MPPIAEVTDQEFALSAADFELKPTDKPIIFRSFIEGVGTHAIGVGFPGGRLAVSK
mgnify:CR=1 FL=1